MMFGFCITVVAMISPGLSYYNEARCGQQVQDNQWHPIRISYDMIGFAGQGMDQSKVGMFMAAIDNAIRYWSQTLQVRGSNSPTPLLYERPCASRIAGYCIKAKKLSTVKETGKIVYPIGSGREILIDPSDLDQLDLYRCQETCVLGLSLPAGPGSGRFSDSDLHLHFHYEKSIKTIASAHDIGFDDCGRPSIGSVAVSPGALAIGPVEAMSVVLHEMMHVFGFSGARMSQWVSSVTGRLMVDRGNQFTLKVWIEQDKLGESKITSALPHLSVPAIVKESQRKWSGHEIPVPYHGIGIMTLRDPTLCKCPMHPSDLFTEQDLLDCFNYPKNCVIGVTADPVVQAAKEYYGCDRMEGVELESPPGPTVRFLNFHWKARNLQSELMNAYIINNGGISFISPMTLSFLASTGWYAVDTQFGVTRPVPGIHWGNGDGCDIVERSFIEYSEFSDEIASFIALPNTSRELNGSFLGATPHGESECSSNAFSSFLRDSGYEEGLRLYFVNCFIAGSDYQRRCLNVRDRFGTNTGTRGWCFEISCNPKLTEYTFGNSDQVLGTCGQKGEKNILNEFSEYFCADPAIVCAQLRYSHFPVEMGINRPPGWAIGQKLENRKRKFFAPHDDPSSGQAKDNDMPPTESERDSPNNIDFVDNDNFSS